MERMLGERLKIIRFNASPDPPSPLAVLSAEL
jgi:hypothetical protein